MGRAALLLGAVGMAVAACGSSDDSGGSASLTGGGSGGIVTVESVDGAKALADASGHTLYTTTAESAGDVKCVDACTSFWQPLTASAQQAKQATAAVGGQFGVVDRPDGGTQLTYGGLPLYTFSEEGPGEMQGDGFTDDFQGTHFEWSAAVTDGSTPTSGGGSSGSGGYGGGGGGYGY
jgi:predicted lipoprotein with Yx(FWY)xxD motif